MRRRHPRTRFRPCDRPGCEPWWTLRSQSYQMKGTHDGLPVRSVRWALPPVGAVHRLGGQTGIGCRSLQYMDFTLTWNYLFAVRYADVCNPLQPRFRSDIVGVVLGHP